MASSINLQADATVGTLTKTGDATGNLTLQTNGNTALTINTGQNITFNGTGAFTVPVGNTAPVPYPTDGNLYYWDEATLSWVEYIQ